MNVKNAHCLFEQSGTFKREFKKLGINAFDYDIENPSGEVDFNLDLFAEINKAYDGYSSIFDLFKPDDLLMAFFPCVRFETQIIMHIKGIAFDVRDWPDDKKIENSMNLIEEVGIMYKLLCKLCLICYKRNLRLIIENPYKEENFLNRYFPLKPNVVDMDRRKFGDSFTKPTQYWFINCKPENNINFESIEPKAKKKVLVERGIHRSAIEEGYANRFIRDFILEAK